MKKYFLIALILCTAFVLTACGSAEPSPVSQPDVPSEAPAAEPESAAWAPDGPVTMIVAYKVGSGTDNTARVLTKFAEKYIGQTVEIENIDGGSGSDGWSELASAETDGMTIGFLNLPNFSTSIVNNLGSYTIDNFTAICNHVTETSIVVVRANDDRFPDLVSLADYGKEHEGTPDELKASTNGIQASNHIGAQAFAQSAGFHYLDIPQSNTTDELKSLLGQEADFCVIKVADLPGMASELKVLGVSDEIVSFYESAFNAAMNDPDYLAEASAEGITTDFMDAADTEEMINQQQAFAESLSDGFWFDEP